MSKKSYIIMKLVIRVLIISVIVYFCIFGFYIIQEYYIENKVLSFDLDGDGLFSKFEQTEDWNKWFNLSINDGGMSYLPILAIPVSLITSLILNILIFVIKYFLKRLRLNP